MILDFRKQRPGAEIRTDVCVIGSGPAGISLVRELRGSGLDVCLLESGGGDDWMGRTQDLSRGVDPNAGWPYQPLEATRVRLLGGTSIVWEGACLPLDAADFQVRPWVPHSGWPIARSALEPYYRRAATVCELGSAEYGPRLWEQFGHPQLALDPRKLDARFWQYSPPTHFGPVYEPELERAEKVRVYLYANAVGLRADADGRRVRHVEVRALDGNAARVVARAYVLATGGIENARLLLNSNDVEEAGLGNRNGLVGRYFMEHSYYQGGYLVSEDLERAVAPFRHLRRDGVHVLAGLRLSDASQAEARILNCCGLLDDRFRVPNPGITAMRRIEEQLQFGRLPPEMGRKIYDVLTHLDAVLPSVYGRLAHGDARRYEEKGIGVMIQAEQAPNPSNRVFLASERDELGLRRVNLEWRLGELERRTIEVATRKVATELTRLGLGRVRVAEWVTDADDAGWRVGLRWGHHHMGTTRMSHDPAAGVVDPDCRMHHVHNLYVAGSSVFPTGGYANPTLSIVALAVRLADHLKGALR
jgi:choline dehydrogenase-like flavoprotein